MKKSWLFSTIILVVFVSCKNDMSEVEALEDRMRVKVELVEDVEILYSDSARVKVRITGAEMLNNVDLTRPYQEFTKGVLVEFFNPDQEITSTMVAQYAIRREREGEVVARDSVVWESTDGQKLESEELIWNEKEEEVYTNKFARIITQRQIIYGHGFRAQQDFSNARIQQVEGIINIDDNK